jgi:hypothetical protein
MNQTIIEHYFKQLVEKPIKSPEVLWNTGDSGATPEGWDILQDNLFSHTLGNRGIQAQLIHHNGIIQSGQVLIYGETVGFFIRVSGLHIIGADSNPYNWMAIWGTQPIGFYEDHYEAISAIALAETG